MNKLDKAWKDYNKVIENYAQERFNAVVKPYLDKHHYSLYTGNGTYLIYDKNRPHDYIDPEYDLPKRVYNTLEIEVPGYEYAQSLAGFMSDYVPDD